MLYCAINGKQTTNIHCLDRGLAYGDGVFTTAKIINGNIVQLKEHLERLRQSCHKLFLKFPDINQLNQQLIVQAKAYNLAVLKVIITAGVGGRGYSRKGVSSPHCIVCIFDYPQHYLQWQKQGICLVDATFQLGINPALSGIKHLNRLEQVLLRQELDQQSADDLLVTDINQFVVETSCANIFWQKGNTWQTPKITFSGIAGLLRADIMRKNTIEEVSITRDDFHSSLKQINAMFICNSVMGIVPVKVYNRHHLSIDPVNQYCQQFNERELSL